MPRPQSLIFLGLNAVRALSIIGMLLVFSSTILVMVTNVKAVNRFQSNRIANATDDMLDCDYIEGSTVPNQAAGVFWAIVASLLILFQVIILLLSELSWPMSFFDRFFPVLGSNFGLGALGIFQALIGAQILSHHVDDFTLVSAFFLFSIGCLNMLLGLIFREGAKAKRSLRGHKQQKQQGIITGQGINPRVLEVAPTFTIPAFPGARDGSADAEKLDDASFHSWRSDTKAGYGFGRQGEKAAGLRGFILQRPEETLPRYASPAPSATRVPVPQEPAPSRELAPSPAPSRSLRNAPNYSYNSRSHSRSRTPSPTRSESARSESEYSHHSSSSFASPMSYRETIHTIPDSPTEEERPEMPVPLHAVQHQMPSGRYQYPASGRRNPTAF
ncbi:hypothetical protein MKEN_01230200 [Mycena kentingensis (nom. inval.)]|nr:hypothetical protein MKEN_01230200 [Mycena kentingensis (nom. inval.)]